MFINVNIFYRSKVRNGKRKMKASGGSERESVGSHDTGIYLNPDDVDSAEPRRANGEAAYDRTSESDDKGMHPSMSSAEGDDRVRHHTSLIYRRTSIEKTSAWLQQQSSKHSSLDSNISVVTCKPPLQNSNTLTSSCDKHRNAVSSSQSEPSLATLGTKSSADSLDLSKSSVPLVPDDMPGSVPCGRVSRKDELLTEVRNGSIQKSRQLRFCCILPDRHEDRRRSAPTVSSDDLHKSLHEETRSCSSAVIRPDNLFDETCSSNNLCCASASSLNDTEDPSPQDDAVSVANSNTSISDTCNSSLKSSTEDLVSAINPKRTCMMEGGSPISFARPFSGTHRHNHHHHHHRSHISSFGVRHRKRSSQDCSGRNHLAAAYDLKRSSPETLLADSTSVEVPGVDNTNVSSPNDSPSVPASTDDEMSSMMHVSPSKCHHSRQSRKTLGSVRCSRSGEKCSGCVGNLDSASVERKDGLRRPNGSSCGKIIELRLLESTGISSGDSDGESAKKKAKAASSAKVGL